MKEHPIISTAEEVRAVLDGRKSQIRRIIKGIHSDYIETCDIMHWCPYGKVGDVLWVRETLENYSEPDVHYNELRYAENHFTQIDAEIPKDYEPNFKWHRTIDGIVQIIPSIFMPKWAARIWLEITNIRVERVQEISESDAKAEGIKPWYIENESGEKVFVGYFPGFQPFWNSLNEKRGYGWDKNPWVWVIEFKRIEHNA